MPRYAALIRNERTGVVSVSNERKDVCLAWMKSNDWGLPEDHRPLAGLANTAGYDRNKWVGFLRKVPEFTDYIIFHEDWQVFPLQWSWQEILWAYSGVRQIWENESSVDRTFELLDMGYTPRDAWILGLSYSKSGNNWRRSHISTGHNCIQNRDVQCPMPMAIRQGLKIARENGLPFWRGIDGTNQLQPVGTLDSMYDLTRLGDKKSRRDMPDYFEPKLGGELTDTFKEFLHDS